MATLAATLEATLEATLAATPVATLAALALTSTIPPTRVDAGGDV